MKLLKTASASVLALSLSLSAALPAGISPAGITVSAYGYDSSRAEEYICERLAALDDVIDISAYSLSLDELQAAYNRILLSRCDLFFVAPQLNYMRDPSGTVLAIKPVYYYSKDKIPLYREQLENAADSIIAEIPSDWDDVRKALFVHDRIAVTSSYNTNNQKRTAYEILVNKNGVCFAYSMAYKYILDKLGIECISVYSPDMDHNWNMIKIGSQWYHVDVTFDDTVPNLNGLVNHEYFLVSDSAVSVGTYPHKGWQYGYRASDTRYDSLFWKDSCAQIIQYSDECWYYINNKKGYLCSYDPVSGRTTELAKIGSGYRYSRIAVYEGTIFCNDKKTLYAYNTADGSFSKVKSYSLGTDNEIYGMYSDGKKIVIDVSSSFTDKNISTLTALKLSEYKPAPAKSAALSAPTGLKASKGKGSVTLSWDKDSSADGYIVYYVITTKKGEKLKKLGITKSTSFLDPGLSKGTYVYAVRSYRIENGKYVYSDVSEKIKVKIS